MMRKILTTILAAFVFANLASAEERPVVIELYTSQGCSSCPPADALLQELATRDNVVALALHVDYWDYIGWKDKFADPEHTKRQRLYASVAGRRMIYTPQMIINGQEGVVGNRPRDVNELIRKYASKESYVDLDVTRTGDSLRITAKAMDGLTGTMSIQIARYRPKSTVDITKGENAGRTLNYSNIVTELTEVATWDTRRPLDVKALAQGDQPIVVLVQRDGLGPIEAVQVLR